MGEILPLFVGAIGVLCASAGLSHAEQKDDFWPEDAAKMVGVELHASLEHAERDAIKLLDSGEKELERRPEGAYFAIKYLQRIRSIKAVPVLCDRLLYEQKVIRNPGTTSPKAKYPAVPALIEIGTPSIDWLLLKIGNSDTSTKYRETTFIVLEEVLGKDRVLEAIERFQRQAKKYQKSTDHPLYKEYKAVDQKKLETLKEEFLKRWRS